MVKKYRIVAVLFLSLVLAGAYYLFVPKKSVIVADNFVRSSITLALYDLLDLGVVDINNDGNLDVFTTNHSARQSALLNTGNGEFKESLDDFRLGQDHDIPGIEDAYQAPELTESGYYIYRKSRWLYIVAHNVGDGAPLKGTLEVPWPINVKKQKKSKVRFIKRADKDPSRITSIEFAVNNKGLVQLIGNEDIVELPHMFNLDESVDLSSIFIGQQRVNPKKHQFTLHWRDRHSMAWADVNDDGLLDVHVGRGGVKGKIDQVPLPIVDELFINKGTHFEDELSDYPMVKKACPGRQAAWTDLDRNGLLDLYVSCGRTGSDQFPNLAFSRQPGGQFADVGEKLNLAFGVETEFVWIDSDNDSDLDLLLLKGSTLTHYRNKDGTFSAETVVDPIVSIGFVKFSVADIDRDSDPDVFLVSREASLLLRNDGDGFTQVEPSSLGLPDKVYSADWVDIDNDGLVDLHSVPGGIYRQSENNKFTSTGQLDMFVDFSRISASRCSWFDADNDGTRDALCAVQSFPGKIFRIIHKLIHKNSRHYYWKSFYFKNNHHENHWLQVKLTGPDGNRQAIGAKVDVISESGKQSQSTGQNEGSLYSQGHYRFYFGLGGDEIAKSVVVTWPDGSVNSLDNISADQLLSVSYD